MYRRQIASALYTAHNKTKKLEKFKLRHRNKQTQWYEERRVVLQVCTLEKSCNIIIGLLLVHILAEILVSFFNFKIIRYKNG